MTLLEVLLDVGDRLNAALPQADAEALAALYEEREAILAQLQAAPPRVLADLEALRPRLRAQHEQTTRLLALRAREAADALARLDQLGRARQHYAPLPTRSSILTAHG